MIEPLVYSILEKACSKMQDRFSQIFSFLSRTIKNSAIGRNQPREKQWGDYFEIKDLRVDVKEVFRVRENRLLWLAEAKEQAASLDDAFQKNDSLRAVNA